MALTNNERDQMNEIEYEGWLEYHEMFGLSAEEADDQYDGRDA